MNNNIIVSITFAKVQRISHFPLICYRLFGLFKSLFDLHQKTLATLSSAANAFFICAITKFLRDLDQQQPVPYQPHYPRTS